jgi:hypothetical protein
MMNLLASLLLAASVSQPPGAAIVAGAWQIHGSVFFNAVDTICHFKDDAGMTTATCESDGVLGPFTAATIKGAEVVWSWDSGPAVLTFDARLTSATSMKGEIRVRGFSGSFTATKLAEAPQQAQPGTP